VAPEKIERFLAANWSVLSMLLTEHGPWEGLKGANQEVIRFQTTAHTLALILGLLGTGSDHMKAYLESKGLRTRLGEIFEPGEDVDLLSSGTQVFAWNGKESPIQSSREQNAFRARTDRISHAGIAFVPSSPHGANLSGGLLTLRYRSSTPLGPILTLKPADTSAAVQGLIPTEVFCRFTDTGGRDQEMAIPLPATPGLASIKELVITFGPESQARPLDLSITRLRVAPIVGQGVQRQ
jgi:hypothetical protein